jgi:hypothetical protein
MSSIFFSVNSFLLHAVAAGGVYFATGGVILLHANLTVHDIDPTIGDPGAEKSDPGGRPALSLTKCIMQIC